MPITYQDPNRKKIIRQPLTKRIRNYYRAARKSSIENLFYQKMYMDISRIYIELELLNTSIFNKIKSIVGAETTSNDNIDLEQDSSYFGAKYYDLSDDTVSFFYNENHATPSFLEVSNIYTTNSISAKLSNLNFKINQLERRVR